MQLAIGIHLMCVGFTIGMTCPDSSQWKFQDSGYCNHTHPWYSCLYDENRMMYIEFCRERPDFQRPGYKFIIRGDLDGKPCDDTYYQPFKFWTNGSSHCIFKKSTCNEEGQLTFNNGKGTSNRKCRCDYTAGYAFVTKPKATCFCNPEQEDCACFLIACKPFYVLTPDYECIRQIEWSGDFMCPLQEESSLNEEQTTKSSACPFLKARSKDNMYEYKNMRQPTYIAILVLLITFVMLITICKKCLRKSLEKCRDILQIKEHIAKEVQEGIRNYITDEAVARLQLEFNYKDIVTKIKPGPIVEQLLSRGILKADDKAEINKCLGSLKRNQKLLEILWKSGIKGYKEFMSVLERDSTYNQLVAKIKKNEGSKSDIKTLITECDGLHNDKIPKDIRDLNEQNLMEWLKSDQKFVETEATMQVKKQLRSDNCVLIVGGPGSGKSSILRHIAIDLCNSEDFDVVPVLIEPSSIFQYYSCDRKQIFVIDDLCGMHETCPQSVNIWALQIEHILLLLGIDITGTNKNQQGDFKLLITCSSDIYKDINFIRDKIPYKYVCKLSDFKLSKEEMREMMFKVKSNKHDLKSLEEYMPSNEFEFPLLATLCDRRNTNEQFEILNDPLNYIVTDLQEIRDKHNIEYCAIAVCALLDNSFKVEFSNNKALSNFLTYLNEFYLENFASPDKHSLISKIQDKFQQLENTRMCTYIKKTNNTYHFVHERIFDIAAAHCGQTFVNGFIDHASSQFIGERYCLETEKHIQHCVVIKNKDQKRYFDRLIRDLENGIIGSTFHNKQLHTKDYRKQFADYCETRKPKIIEIFEKLNCKEKNSSDLVQSIDTFETIDLTKDYTHFRRKIYSYCFESNIPLIESVWLGYPDLVELLLKMKCDVNTTDMFNRSPLFIASFLGYIEIVILLIENKAEMCNIQGRSPLYAACEEGRNDVVKYLASNGADILQCDQNRRSPIFVASATGHKNIVRFLITKSNSNISKPDYMGQTPLFVASLRGRKDIVSILLDHNADIDTIDKRGFSSLFIAAMNGHREVVKCLLDKKAKAIHCDHDGRSPLFIACQEGHYELVKLLLEYDKTMISVCNWQKQSPMFIACSKGHISIVKILIEYSADVNQCDEDGKSPLFIACERGNNEVVSVLLEKKAIVEKCDKDKRSPFYIASRSGNVEIMNHLLLKNANPSHCNKWGGSVLNITCREGHISAVKLLLKNGADYSKKDAIGNSPLHIAAEEGHTEIVQILITDKADVNSTNKENETPLHAACEHGHRDVVKILLDNQAQINLKDNYGNKPKDFALKQKRTSIIELFDKK